MQCFRGAEEECFLHRRRPPGWPDNRLQHPSRSTKHLAHVKRDSDHHTLQSAHIRVYGNRLSGVSETKCVVCAFQHVSFVTFERHLRLEFVVVVDTFGVRSACGWGCS